MAECTFLLALEDEDIGELLAGHVYSYIVCLSC